MLTFLKNVPTLYDVFSTSGHVILGFILVIFKSSNKYLSKGGLDKHQVRWLSSCIQIKSHVLPFFDGGESRERVGHRNMPFIFVIVPWLKFRREGATSWNFMVLFLDHVSG